MPYMNTTRRYAILIGVPESPHGPLPGAAVDPGQFAQYLMSDYGGAWERDEIRILRTPTQSEVVYELGRARNGDYAFISFSGHGYLERAPSADSSKVCLKGTEEMYVSELNPGCDRVTRIIDACREVFVLKEKVEKHFGLGEARAAIQTDRLACRKDFDDSLTDAGKGVVTLFSCGVNETAHEDKNMGGYFSHFLVSKSRGICASTSTRGILGMPTAFGAAKAATVKANPQQTPEYHSGRRMKHFPFGVVA